ncbi:tRNA pseudouridine synthase B [Tepidimonas alkaliphilus]|uniref:tRNA pseudouridine synthase B n=1 Tax=Tepidimonas alkaliphilus TaxID=2588942 RepID=A0A554WAI2_9BURK|nr:tRNA pseudouridine(55) synthase TruB [Tepidimonas alkaliphilus]TSE20579.1 tRNA pseudouridine synthase B [Tepidimonas alkaliphilus]
MTAEPRARVRRRPVHGVLLLDKPVGLSAQAAVSRVKALLAAEKAGHTGTLDPLASGLLPVCLGAATKFAQVQLEADKAYEAVLRLGVRTSTGDAEGEVIATAPVEAERLTPARLAELARRFTGVIEQIPPMHSALKKDGKALYEYARAGVELERAPRRVTIHALELEPLPHDPAALRLRVRCSKGTYVRTLAEDLGAALGCGAHLSALRRTATGPFELAEAVTLEQLEQATMPQRLQWLRPPEALLHGWPQVTLEEGEAARFLSGLRRRGRWPDAEAVAVFGAKPRALLGSGRCQGGELIPVRLLAPTEIAQWLTQTHAS